MIVEITESSALEIQVGARTDAGCTRAYNEDAFSCYRADLPASLLAQRGWLFAVADGVGGRKAGEVASRYAVQRLQEVYYSRDSGDEIATALQDCVGQVNHELYEKSWSEPALNQMATTLVCAVVRGADLYVANVGDSRAYLIRNGVARRLTTDHSLAMELVRLGRITEEAALSHPFLAVLSRSLGKRVPIETDTFHKELQVEDVIVLCSDGLWGQVSGGELAEIAGRSPLQQAADDLVALANERGGPDNISAIVLRLQPAGPLRERAAERVMNFFARLLNPG